MDKMKKLHQQRMALIKELQVVIREAEKNNELLLQGLDNLRRFNNGLQDGIEAIGGTNPMEIQPSLS